MSKTTSWQPILGRHTAHTQKQGHQLSVYSVSYNFFCVPRSNCTVYLNFCIILTAYFIIFLCCCCRAGKRLSVHRSFVEAQLILRCGLRPDLSSHYQLPLMQGFLSPTHPPIFAHNLERPLGSTHIGPGQLSLNSLLPITLRNDHNPSSQFPGAVEVDTSSCIFTILELYQHFLSQPIDLPLLQHVLVSVVLLSDQFVLSNQFEWMLSTFLGLLDQPLSEDVVTLAVLVMGAIKAATVLRVVSVIWLECLCISLGWCLCRRKAKWTRLQNSWRHL